MATPTPIPLTIEGSRLVLEQFGVWPLVMLGAIIFVAGVLYRRFRR